jgi:antimicrobial peptide system SdpB family protein
MNPLPRSLAIGRTMIALAELSVILFTRNDVLIVSAISPWNGSRCGGLRAASLGCLVGGTPTAAGVGKALIVATLCLVASGFRPRWTCLPHWYVTASIAVSIDPHNGGDYVAQIVTMLLVPICLGDPRVWQWRRHAGPLSPGWQGTASAALLTLRVQVIVIYALSAFSKAVDGAWRSGLALRIVADNLSYGPVPPLSRVLHALGNAPGAAPAAAWAVMSLEAIIAVAVGAGPRGRAIALVLGFLFHLGTIVVLRIPSFGAVMIGLLIIVCGPDSWRLCREAARRRARPGDRRGGEDARAAGPGPAGAGTGDSGTAHPRRAVLQGGRHHPFR